MADTTLCLTCFSSCYKTTIPSGTADVIYKRTHSEWGVNDEVQWWFLENDIWNEVTDTTDLAALNALDDTSKVSCDAIGGGTAGCTPKSKSETVTIGCDSVTGVTDNNNGTYTWTHNLALAEPTSINFTYPVVSATANSVTFIVSPDCPGSVVLSLYSFGAADCAPTNGGGDGTTTLEAENGLHVHDGKAHLGGELIEDTTIDLMEFYYNLKGQSADYVKNFTKEMNFEEFMTQWSNDSLLRSLTLIEKAQLFKVIAFGQGTNGNPNEAEMSVIMQGIRFRLINEASFEVINQSGIYNLGNVPLDKNNEAEYNLVIKEDGTVLKTLNYHQDASVCYSSTDSPTNFVFQLPSTPIDKATIDSMVSGTATGYVSQTDYASFTNTGYTADALYFGYEYIKSAATQLVGATPNVKLQTLYMPNLTSVVDPACFATVTGQKMTVIVPIAMQTDPAFVALAANNTVTFLDSDVLSGGIGFKKVISNRSVRYFDSTGVEVTDLAVIAAYEAYIKSFAVFATNCSGTVTADNGLHVHDGDVHLGGTLIEDTVINANQKIYEITDSTFLPDGFRNYYFSSKYDPMAGEFDQIFTDGTKSTLFYQNDNGMGLRASQLRDNAVTIDHAGVNIGGLGITLNASTYTIKNVTRNDEAEFILVQNGDLVHKTSKLNSILKVTRDDRLAYDPTDLVNGMYVHQTDGTQIGLHYWDGIQWNYIPSVPSI